MSQAGWEQAVGEIATYRSINRVSDRVPLEQTFTAQASDEAPVRAVVDRLTRQQQSRAAIALTMLSARPSGRWPRPAGELPSMTPYRPRAEACPSAPATARPTTPRPSRHPLRAGRRHVARTCEQ